MEPVQAQSATRAVAVIAADEILQRRAIAARRRDGLAVSTEAEAAALVVVSDGGWRQVLAMVVLGCSNAEVATTLHVVRPDVRPAAAQVGDPGHPRGDTDPL